MGKRLGKGYNVYTKKVNYKAPRKNRGIILILLIANLEAFKSLEVIYTN
jgi:hypothetical protein